MEKKFNKFELARLKRTAQNVAQYVAKKNRLVAQINKLQEELNGVTEMIEVTDAATVAMTGGYHSEEIIKKVITPTDKVDKSGNIIKMTSFEFIYPDTIVPPVVEETVVETTEETVNVTDETAEDNTYDYVPGVDL